MSNEQIIADIYQKLLTCIMNVIIFGILGVGSLGVMLGGSYYLFTKNKDLSIKNREDNTSNTNSKKDS